ncbi:sushi, von Willebrand factor type A, EGF and pentraxin domain-containing protein 1-like isoform X2 [Halichondria panicea]|uniref:sushi, von Willebrand factor type A, EGF and pentraxin domain-containing protein 1-like isoform X2 n=1 Tax=Halichondria panicea TaxID=6063 RepID=UPI00312B7638
MLVYKLGTLLLALTVGTIAIQQPAVSTFSVRQLYSRQRARLQQQAENTCFSVHGHGCCPTGNDCSVTNPLSSPCFCDVGCHIYGDCCNDAIRNGCPAAGMCADLPSILNGAIAYNDNTMHQKPVNTVATYSCNAGHTLYNGSTTRTCQDSVWTGSSPTCKGVCQALPPLAHGTIMYTENSRSIRTVAKYSCDQGYQLAGLEKRVCQGSSGWSGMIPPQCKAVTCMAKYPGTGCTTVINAGLLGIYPNPRCSCHISCFSNSDTTCCEDIGCVPTTCDQAGMTQGCCSWDSQGGCYVPGGMCYCDSECNTAGDCCSDVPSTPTCTASVVGQSRVRGQSVRTYPFGRAQLARGGRRTQASMEDQAARNLASVLMSMSQEAVESKHRWEVMADELEHIQKKLN